VESIAGFSIPSLSLGQILQRGLAALVVVGLHGWALAFVAERLGDPGPRHDGRRRLNPLAHLDIVGLVHAVFFRVTWIPRLDVDVGRLRGTWMGALVMVATGSALLVVLSATSLLLRPLVVSVLRGSAALTVNSVMGSVADIAVLTAVVHLLPLPPLAGEAWAPWGRKWKGWRDPRLRWVGVLILLLWSMSGLTTRYASTLLEAWRTLLGF
jgi:hypothetical protein